MPIAIGVTLLSAGNGDDRFIYKFTYVTLKCVHISRKNYCRAISEESCALHAFSHRDTTNPLKTSFCFGNSINLLCVFARLPVELSPNVMKTKLNCK